MCYAKVVKIKDEKFWAKTKSITNGCIEWQGSTFANGYGCVRRRKLPNSRIRSNRYAYYLYNGEYPKYFACHTCDNPKCVNPLHLYDGTPKQNARDRENRGRGHDQRGERNGNAKLTQADVKRIRNMKGTLKQIAKEFEVSFSIISLIRRNEKWIDY